MPIYEFYCSRCHVVYNFFSRTVDTGSAPDCPRCGKAGLERRASRFAISTGRDDTGENDLPDLDEGALEAAMASMAREAESLDENDPRQAARLMRRLTEATGMPIGEGMEEALRRMEAGEDPEAVEEELGDVLDDDDALTARPRRLRSLARRLRPPRVDETIYEM